MKKTKTWGLFLALIAVIAIGFAVSCDDGNLPCEHTGGTATCVEQAVCEKCNLPYGSTDSNNHDFSDNAEVCKREGCDVANPDYVPPCECEGVEDCECEDCECELCKGDEPCPCCETLDCTCEDCPDCECNESDEPCNCCGEDCECVDCTETDCEECAIPCSHTGGTATCTEQAVCEVCDEPYGDTDPTNHDFADDKCDTVCGREGCSVTVKADGEHTPIPNTTKNKDATCEDDGWKDATICEDCETELDAGIKINKLAHNMDWVETTVSYISEGEETYTCIDCGHTDGTRPIPQIPVTDRAFLNTLLSGLEANTAETPYTILLNVDWLGGSSTFNGSVGNALSDNNTKFVNLDMSGSTFEYDDFSEGIYFDSSAFLWCDNLTGIIIPDNVTHIGGGAFNQCTGLTSITIPNSVTYIEDVAFFDCIGLTSITIPDSVTDIWDYAFYGCTNITSIEIPASVTYLGIGVFQTWTADQTIIVPFSGEDAADLAWGGSDWRLGCNATIQYTP